jgi:hypothetical protein
MGTDEHSGKRGYIPVYTSRELSQYSPELNIGDFIGSNQHPSQVFARLVIKGRTPYFVL